MSTPPRVDIVNINFLDWSGTRAYSGGAERYVHDLALLCARMGFLPRIVQNADVPFTKHLDGIEIVGIPAAKSVDFKALSAGMANAVADAHLVIASPLELACRMPAGMPVIGINHGIWWDNPEAALKDLQAVKALVTESLTRTSCTVAVDTNFINWMRASHLALSKPVVYLPNYVALDRFVAVDKSFEGRLRVLFPRRLCTERGFPMVLDAFEQLFAQRDDLELAICGGGPVEAEALASAFVARHLGRAQWLETAMDDMPGVYANSHVVIIPTVYSEGTSLSCLEAMATNNAVIATDVGGLPNLVFDGYNGLLIAQGMPALLAAITRLADDRALLARLARQATGVAAAFARTRWERAWAQVIASVVDVDLRRALPQLDGMLHGLEAGMRGLEVADTAAARARDTDVYTATHAAQQLVTLRGSQLDAMRAELDRARAELAQRQRALDELEQQALESAAQARADIANLGARLEATHILRIAAERDAEAGRSLVNALATERDGLRDELDATRSALAGERQQLQEVTAARSAAEGSVVKLRSATQSQAVAIDELTQVAASRKAELEVARARHDTDAARDAEHKHYIRTLEAVVASRDDGIAWLRNELRTVLEAVKHRRSSLKLLAVDGLYALNERVPAMRGAARAVLPERVRERVFRHSLENSLASRFAAAAPAAAAPASFPRAMVEAPQEVVESNTARQTPAPRDAAYDVLCFAIIEWGARFQRPQHLMSRLAAAGHRVFCIVASKLPPEGKKYGIERVAPNVFEVSLAVERAQDFYATAPTDGNLAAMLEALVALAADQKITTAISLVQLPYWTPLALDLRNERRWPVVYDCMDEWEDFPNIGKPLLQLERALVDAADLVTVTGSLLATKWQPHAQRCVTVRNGVDFEFFAKHCVPNAHLHGLRRPVIGYYGALAEWVDLELLAAVAKARPDWTFVLVGDVFVKDVDGLDKLPNVRMTGRRPYAEMPEFLYHFDVCLVPFKLNDVTHAVDPVKFYEYLSAGKPVVSVPLEEMQIYAGYAYFARGRDEFISQIEAALQERDTGAWAARIALARANDWRARHASMAAAIREVHAKVSIIIVAFNNAQMTRDCIESIYRNTAWPNFDVIVVDNASTDETRAWLRYLARTRDNATVIFNETNRGFAAANNQGLAVAKGDVFVLLNNDTVVPRGWLDPLLARLDDPAVGMVGPVTNFVGNEARITVPYSSIDDMEGFAVEWMERHRAAAFDIAMLAMFCVAFKRRLFEQVGPLDESFGIGMFEDDDYSRRVQALGLRTLCVPASFVHHFGQASFRKLIDSGEYDKLWKRNQAIYEKKWGVWKAHTTARSDYPDRVDSD